MHEDDPLEAFDPHVVTLDGATKVVQAAAFDSVQLPRERRCDFRRERSRQPCSSSLDFMACEWHN